MQVVPYILLAAVMLVGLAGVVGIVKAQRKRFRKHRANRERERLYAARMTNVVRIGADPYVPTVRLHVLAEAPRDLEQAVRFARIAKPPPIPARARIARGSAPPPISAAAGPTRPQPPALPEVRFESRGRRT